MISVAHGCGGDGGFNHFTVPFLGFGPVSRASVVCVLVYLDRCLDAACLTTARQIAAIHALIAPATFRAIGANSAVIAVVANGANRAICAVCAPAALYAIGADPQASATSAPGALLAFCAFVTIGAVCAAIAIVAIVAIDAIKTIDAVCAVCAVDAVDVTVYVCRCCRCHLFALRVCGLCCPVNTQCPIKRGMSTFILLF